MKITPPLALIIFLIISSCTSTKREMDTTSMEPTLLRGQSILIESTDSIIRKDIIAFRYSKPSMSEKTWVFRVIGVPGDKIEIKKGVVFVNDKMDEEPNIKLSNKLVDSGVFQNEILGSTKENGWNIDNYGPVIIPKPKELINLNADNKNLYKDFVDADGKIKTDLFFVMGDNRHDAYDSRFIGLIPKSAVVGIVKR